MNIAAILACKKYRSRYDGCNDDDGDGEDDYVVVDGDDADDARDACDGGGDGCDKFCVNHEDRTSASPFEARM